MVNSTNFFFSVVLISLLLTALSKPKQLCKMVYNLTPIQFDPFSVDFLKRVLKNHWKNKWAAYQ